MSAPPSVACVGLYHSAWSRKRMILLMKGFSQRYLFEKTNKNKNEKVEKTDKNGEVPLYVFGKMRNNSSILLYSKG